MLNPSTVYLANVTLMAFCLAVAWAMIRSCPAFSEIPRLAGWKGKFSLWWYQQNRFFSVLTILFGLKLYWIHGYAANIPFWDQWDAEGWALYRPFLEGNLSWGRMILAHNEHRILWTRILALGQFILNGQWDILWQVVVNALFHSFIGAAFFEIILRYFKNRAPFFWMVIIGVVFAGPYGCGNFLFGFQSQFYFLQFFGAASLVLLFGTRPGGPFWYLGWVCLVFAYFSMAGGVLVSGVVLIGSIFRLVLVRSDRKWGLGGLWIFTAILLFVGGIWGIPPVAHHDSLKATGAWHLAENFLHLTAWPFASPIFSLNQALGFAVLLWSPWLLCVLLGLFKSSFRSSLGKGYWLILTFGGWVLATALGCAYSRGNSQSFGYTDRYADLFGMGALLGFITITILIFSHFSGVLKRLFIGVGISSAITWSVGLYLINLHAYEFSLPLYGESGVRQIDNIDHFVQTGERSYLLKEPQKEVPLGDPQRLESFLTHPTYRDFLPWTIRKPIPMQEEEKQDKAPLVPGGISPSSADRPGETFWGSFHPETGETYQVESLLEPLRPPQLPFLVVFLSGYPRAEGIRVHALTEGREAQNLWRTQPGDAWLERRFAAGKQFLGLKVRDQSQETWVAVSEPRELGWFSYAAILVSNRFDWVLALGLILWAVTYASYPLCFRHNPLHFWQRLIQSLQAFHSTWRDWKSPSDRDQSS